MFDHFLRLVGLSKKWTKFSMDEVREHNDRFSLWIVAGNSVYDVTSILDSHPGGANALLRRGGGVKDCTEDFYYHSRATRRTWASYKIGELAPGESDKSGVENTTFVTSSMEEDEGEESSAPQASPINHACALAECKGGRDCCCTSTVETHSSISEPVPERRYGECCHRQVARRVVLQSPL